MPTQKGYRVLVLEKDGTEYSVVALAYQIASGCLNITEVDGGTTSIPQANISKFKTYPVQLTFKSPDELEAERLAQEAANQAQAELEKLNRPAVVQMLEEQADPEKVV